MPVPVTSPVRVIVWSPVFVPLVFASRVIALSSVNLFVAVSVMSSVSRTTTPVCQFTESTAPPPPHTQYSIPVSVEFTFRNLPAAQA